MLTPLRPKRTREQLSSSGNATYRPNHGNYLIQVWPLFMNSTSIHPIDVDPLHYVPVPQLLFTLGLLQIVSARGS